MISNGLLLCHGFMFIIGCQNYLGGDIKRQIIELSNFCWLTRHQSLFYLGGLQQARF